ncbi:MAG: thioredoxin domain-containing protein [Fibrobacter sp.]|nr:thioredoxin domain-containing protein [Fibrobacter sp.]
MTLHTNKLINEKSPYLLQHAHNPVNWFPWSEEAFKEAKLREVPIFLSIGYSSCHWCHVMEKECFNDPQIAELLNRSFVNVKVDREERPDIDMVFMAVCQLLTGSGGWPLTIIMTPDKEPFFAGTYIPRESRFGRIGLIELVKQVDDIWEKKRSEIFDSASIIISRLLSQISIKADSTQIDKRILQKAKEQLLSKFDTENGGFGTEPKFPSAHNLLFLLRYWKQSKEKDALEAVKLTLGSMRSGGIYDHIGFGFHRYSTDKKWRIPHFEKMLPDQAILAMTFTEAFQATGDSLYSRTAEEVLTWVLRDMTGLSGGFYCAQDADSENSEGRFYLWTTDEIRETLPEHDAKWVIETFHLKEEGNIPERESSGIPNVNVLYLDESDKEKFSAGPQWESIRGKLFNKRQKRVAPFKDDKVLTDWNGLMIAAMAKTGQVLGNKSFIEASRRAADFILTTLRKKNGELLHRYRDGEAALEAYLDDYAFMIWGLLELYETTFEAGYLETALKLQEIQNTLFLDEENGGYFFTASNAEKLITRNKENYDGAVPSGNSVSMLNLLRLGGFTGNPQFEKDAARLIQAFSVPLKENPSFYCMLLSAFEFAVGPSVEIVIAGRKEGEDTREMVEALRSVYIPNKVVILCPSDEQEPRINRIVKYSDKYRPIDGKATAFVCRNRVCSSPVTESSEMLELLRRD